jgi:hypothetical protein
VETHNTETFRVVWTGDSETDCVETCRDLQLAGIEYKVSQQPVSRSSRMGVIWRFEVGVADSDYGPATQALGLGADDGAEDQGFEIKESTGPVTEADCREDQTKAADAYLKPWHAENATVEVWSQGASNTSSIVELSLTENLIHYRLDRTKNGLRRFFVLPEDEHRARKILREIERGEPPK